MHHPGERTKWILAFRRGALGVFACLLAATAARGQEPAAPAPLQPAISDVEWLTGEPAGTRIVQFKLDGPKGLRFFVWWSHAGLRGAASTGPVWEKSSDASAFIKVTIDYTLGSKGDRTQNVLTSREEALQMRFDATGGVKEGLTGIGSAPLFSLDPKERQIDFISLATDRLAIDAKGQRRLLFASPKSEIGKPPETITPRSELIVGAYVEPPARKIAEIDQLLGRWWRQPREVGSAHIKFRLHRSGPNSYFPLKPAGVQAILTEVDLEKDPEMFAEFLSMVLKPERRGQLSSEGEFFSLGLKTHERLGLDSERVHDGDLDLNKRQGQVDVHRGNDSRIHRFTLSDFRHEGRITDVSGFEQELKPPSVVLKRDREGRQLEIWADWATGFVRRESFFSGGQLTSEVLQFAPQSHPGGIVFPRLKLRLSYRENELNTLELIYLENAEFNVNMPADAFKLAAAPPVLVILHEPGKSVTERGKQIRVAEPVADLAGFLRKQELKGEQRE